MLKEDRENHFNICKNCKVRKNLAKNFDMQFDWIDCPYDCENDYEHYIKENKNE